MRTEDAQRSPREPGGGEVGGPSADAGPFKGYGHTLGQSPTLILRAPLNALYIVNTLGPLLLEQCVMEHEELLRHDGETYSEGTRRSSPLFFGEGGVMGALIPHKGPWAQECVHGPACSGSQNSPWSSCVLSFVQSFCCVSRTTVIVQPPYDTLPANTI